ncbi:30S ribosomal protein S8 [Candidatus Falkowbacteria bacterium CG_4_9_14_3_um_filter_36_9]|uniref:Small ribosomal subunit protein uS8 n=2 Tax=Candidatus Falkowiibacteriota TaxID=1752728 RepID=A0A2M7DQ35_9BACT|nr:MAG: 30S ribosomal protein S8 [Candidatus Falkowbacteria bacterium CG02_land_8_20_14_3_00_36_14]PIX12094.1 MAG: 30S ribosomal protein S8 [Candidatus Falkowbacteria bacterium CG_4_8_14_3_um_filter_36_11]PJA10867.1 MAG: 30S ribosomal protein S8 [Candidatus Falkowbacteria bacterium CG_4_10_14_0_2_um_filter_36_22]PJB20234.1 MAG: 30S ribosomal protein S8 [Candidatus Falkowbacteria bacterium CG_4_9_14_3_um_filter_36_9]
MTDPIADMLTRIRNASAVYKDEVVLPMSKIKYNIAKILENGGWVNKVEVINRKNEKNKSSKYNELKIILKYKEGHKPVIISLKRISKPGLRIYAKKDELPKVLNNLGIAIISTPQGMMTNKEARKKGVGGEVICEIY